MVYLFNPSILLLIKESLKSLLYMSQESEFVVLFWFFCEDSGKRELQ